MNIDLVCTALNAMTGGLMSRWLTLAPEGWLAGWLALALVTFPVLCPHISICMQFCCGFSMPCDGLEAAGAGG